jgi:hypothetical protein
MKEEGNLPKLKMEGKSLQLVAREIHSFQAVRKQSPISWLVI